VSGTETAAAVFDREAYTIKAEIGTGQFGTVHRALSASRGIDVALKHVRADGADGGIKVKAEERGAELQRCFSSRYKDLVPEIFEHGRAASGDYYIAMELIDGRPLTELVRGATPDSRKAAELALAIADFLVKLHGLSDGKEPILHSDLKPEHVLVLADGSIRILDLGIAKSLQANKSLTGNAWASAPYASPERLEDGQVRAGDDHWALGVMLFEMASGYHPYHQYMSGDNNATLARAIRRTEPPAPLPPSCDAGLAASIRKMLSPQPAHRYQTAEEIVSDLKNFLEGRETAAVAENLKASQRTQVIPSAGTGRVAQSPDTAPTDPMPVARGATTPHPGGRIARAIAAVRAQRWSSGVLVRVGLAALFMIAGLSEGAAWIRAEQFRQRIGGLQVSDIPAIRAELDNMRRLAMFGVGVPLRVRQPLRDHMVSLADRAIMDFRNDLLVTELQWRQSKTCLSLAIEVAPNDRTVAGKARYVDGQLARIAAQGQTAAVKLARLNEAKSRFIESARLDTSSPDPYLGQARINAYDTRDFEALLVNIADAEQRGYKSGRRERAQVGDGFKFKADRALAQSRSASGEGRRRFLEQAAADYQSCITKFEGLANYFGSERNLAYCQRLLGRVKADLGELENTSTFFGVPDADRER
jgi:hypothetical protein